MNRRRTKGGRAAEPSTAEPPSAAEAGTESRPRLRVLFERAARWPARLKRLRRPVQEHPAPRVVFVSLTVGGLLLVIGALLPWSETTDPIFETINGEEVVTGVEFATTRGVSAGGVGGVTLGLGVVIVGIVLLLWQQGLRDAVGLGLPFLAAIAVAAAGVKFDNISSAASQFNAFYEGLDPRVHASRGVGLYVTLVGGIMACLGALRVSIATRKAGQGKRAEEERAGGARGRR